MITRKDFEGPLNIKNGNGFCIITTILSRKWSTTSRFSGDRFWTQAMKRVIHGEPVAIAPTGQRPGRNQIEGNLVVLEPIDLDRHTEALYDVSHESAEARQLWKFLPDGPFEDSADLRALLKTILDAPDRVPYAIRDKAGGRAAGFATYLDIRPRPWGHRNRVHLVCTVSTTNPTVDRSAVPDACLRIRRVRLSTDAMAM